MPSKVFSINLGVLKGVEEDAADGGGNGEDMNGGGRFVTLSINPLMTEVSASCLASMVACKET